MPAPNKEQLLAIEHQGGVLLKAGAGSGKTFVLKEHIIYLIQNWIEESREQPVEFDQFIRNKLRRVVLMTFTKKAAGELEIRVQNEVKRLAAEKANTAWEKVLQNLNYLTITTIHGFCFKLIKQGFFPGILPEQEILDEASFKKLIGTELERWLAQDSNKELEIYELILKEQNQVLSALINIFSDPALRISWEDTHPKELSLKNVDETVQDILKFGGHDELWEDSVDLTHYQEFESKKWYPVLKNFLHVKSTWAMDLEGVCQAYTFFEQMNFKIPVKPSIKTVPAQVVSYYEKFKSFKDFLKKDGENFIRYQKDFKDVIVPWFGMIKDLVKFVANKYDQEPGLTFSDLEYIAYRGLQKQDVAHQVSLQYDYFIVDEFQDTSFIQFSILEQIIKSDYNKLFCVGDIKQAIYGFRGGELGVFLNCEKLVPKNYTLNNNYRSDAHIINFNNEFFDFLFEKGIGFQGIDPGRVPVDHQTVPESNDAKGSVTEIQVNLDFRDNDEKISNLEIDYIESLAILKRLTTSEFSEQAVLYKRLKPSLILIDLLIANDIGFTSQVKIPFLEDPLLGIFDRLVEYELSSSEQKDDYLLYQVKAYLSLLGSTHVDPNESFLLEFQLNQKYFGYYNAFCSLLEKWGIRTSNYSNTIEQIKSLINLSLGDKEQLYNLMQRQREFSYSLDFQYGKNPECIKIMTAHASKGLQFESVVLGGMYTNENSISFTNSIGNLPLSFKWTEGIHGKKRFKTPHYILEDLLRKEKEFSETKRLFYVANTRAVHDLSYISLDLGKHKRAKSQSSSWINGFWAWYSEHEKPKEISLQQYDISDNYSEDYLSLADLKPPLFHIDNLGVLPVKPMDSFLYLPEIAITKLASLAQCPRKFYLQNTCKLSQEDLSIIDQLPTFEKTEVRNTGVSSSAERGIIIHDLISEEIQNELSSGYLERSKDIVNSVAWAVENLKLYLDNYELISERSIKFELLGYMVSGIPDLVLKPKEDSDSLEIWDFKTGAYTENKLETYWFQLFSYAFSQYFLQETSRDKKIKLVLLFVDEKKKVEKTVSIENVEKYISEKLSLIQTPWVENEQACEGCLYRNICQK